MRFLTIAGMVLLTIIAIKVLGIDVNHMWDSGLTFLRELLKK